MLSRAVAIILQSGVRFCLVGVFFIFKCNIGRVRLEMDICHEIVSIKLCFGSNYSIRFNFFFPTPQSFISVCKVREGWGDNN